MVFDELLPLEDISSEIRRCIISSDEIADDASGALKSIRRRITSSEAEVHNLLNKIIKSSSNRDMLMDALITTRNGRYCIPVKVEHRNAFPGMIHDRSSTGSTFFIEPMEAVNMNNEIQELESDERVEIQKILANLSLMAGSAATDIAEDLKLLTELDFIFAKVLCRANADQWTVAIGLWNMLQKEYIYQWYTCFAAGAVVISIPIAILFIYMQRFYVEGMSGAVKG